MNYIANEQIGLYFILREDISLFQSELVSVYETTDELPEFTDLATELYHWCVDTSSALAFDDKSGHLRLSGKEADDFYGGVMLADHHISFLQDLSSSIDAMNLSVLDDHVSKVLKVRNAPYKEVW